MPLQAVEIGSDTSPTRFNTQQSVANGDRIAGFASLDAGFSLENSSVVATFDSFFQVSGIIDMNSGRLNLTRDLLLNNVLGFTTLGSFAGNGHTLEFPERPLILSFGGGTPTWSNLKVFTRENMMLEDCHITFTGESIWNSWGNYLELGSSCTLSVGVGASVLFKDMTLKGINTMKIDAFDNSSTVSFSNVSFVLDGDFSFTLGRIDVIDDLVITGGEHTFNYQSDQISTIYSDGQLTIENGVTFKYDPPIASQTLLALQDATARLMLFSATLASTSTGMQLTTGRFAIDGDSFLSNEGTVSAEGFVFGDGSSAANNIDVRWLPAANLELVSGFLRMNNV